MKFEDKFKAVENKVFINGLLVDSKGGKVFEVVNPADQSVIGTAVAASPQDVDDAAQAANTAFRGVWRNMNDSDRGRILYKFADLLEQNA